MASMDQVAVSSALDEIEKKIGRKPKPQEVVAEAKNTKSPLHRYFTWDNGKAADKWRIEEARRLLAVRMVVVVEDVKLSIPRFLRDADRSSSQQGYAHIEDVRLNGNKARETVLRELKSARGFIRRAWDISQALGIDAQIKRVSGLIDSIIDGLTGEAVEAPKVVTQRKNKAPISAVVAGKALAKTRAGRAGKRA